LQKAAGLAKQRNGRQRGARSQSHYYAQVVGRFEGDNMEGYEDPVYDELSRTANYQSSKSALDGYGSRMNQLNKTLQYNQAKIQKVNLKKNQIKFTPADPTA
jgi:hypothetical protein